MKPLAVTLSHFRGWKAKQRIALDAPITSIIAENGRGKSSLANAIEWCLFGADIAKKGSGIDERQDWELRTRVDKSDAEPTLVKLEMDTPQGTATVARKRSVTAKVRDPDEISVQTSDGKTLEGQDAEAWLRNSRLPDWETYRRAHCFHQEAARQRVVASTERSAILAALLGLDDDLALRSAIDAQQPDKLLADIDKTLELLEGEAHRSLDLPRQRLCDLEAQLCEVGVDRDDFKASRAESFRTQLVTQGSDLARLLGLEVSLPTESDAAGVRAWARTWAGQARASAPALAPLEDRRRAAANLSQRLTKCKEFDGAWRAAREALEAERTAGGDEAQRDNAIAEAEARLEAAGLALERNNARAKLLIDAKTAIEAAGAGDQCPVCDTTVAGLAARLETEAEQLRSDEFRRLEAARQTTRAERDSAVTAREALARLVKTEATTREALEVNQQQLREGLAVDETSGVHDLVAEANKRLEALQSEIARLEAILADRDRLLEVHQSAWAQLDLLEKWLEASQDAEKSIDLSGSAEWQAFNHAIDKAVGFASDLQALSSLARDVQAERSMSREAEVNQTLGKYYALITRDEGRDSVKVKVHQTPQRIQYDLVDAGGQPAVPALNQAAINALSLAVLFAQAEASAKTGAWEAVTLDDPVQSLDAEKQAGLAAAIEVLANNCSVLVAAVPCPFTGRLKDYVSRKRHFVTLGPWSRTEGASILSEERR